MTSAGRVFKPLRRPWFWASLWALAVASVVAVCLMPPPPLALPPGSDKIEHFLAYSVLAGSAVQVYRRGRPLLLATMGLVATGVLVEVLQGALTATRMADPADALANTVGVLAGAALAWTPAANVLLRLRG